MTLRNGMVDLVQELRTLTIAGTADWTLGTVTYWTDDQLQAVLDKYRVDFFASELVEQEQYVGPTGDPTTAGSVIYKRFTTAYKNLETIASGTPYFAVTYANGGTVVEAFTADYTNGILDFTNNQRGTPLYLTGRSFDVNQAAADIWTRKANYYSQAYDIKTDNHSLTRSQLYKQAMSQAEYFKSQSDAGAAVSIDFERSDTR